MTSWVKDTSPFVISKNVFFTLFLMSYYTDGRIIIWMFKALHSKRLRMREPSTRGWSWPWRTSTQVTFSTPSHSTSLILTLSHFCHSQSPSLTHRQSRTSSQATPLLVTHTLTWMLINSNFIVESCVFHTFYTWAKVMFQRQWRWSFCNAMRYGCFLDTLYHRYWILPAVWNYWVWKNQ